jgi:branched-chain amino acid transport system permease protein
VGQGLAFALIMLSLVPLTGYGGQISLAQMVAGLGAVAMGVWVQRQPARSGRAFVLPAIVGAIVALPALRLRGIYLALSTLALAVFMDRVVFSQERGSRAVPHVDRLRLGPIHFESDRLLRAACRGVRHCRARDRVVAARAVRAEGCRR